MRTATKPSLLWASFQPSSPLSRQHSTKPMYVCVCCLYVEGGADRVVMYVYSHQAGKSEAGGTDNRMLLFSYITSPSKRA